MWSCPIGSSHASCLFTLTSNPVLAPIRDSFPLWPLSQVWFPPCWPWDTILSDESRSCRTAWQSNGSLRTSASIRSLPEVVGWGSRKGGERQGTRGDRRRLWVASGARDGFCCPQRHASKHTLLWRWASHFRFYKISQKFQPHIPMMEGGQEDLFLFLPSVRTQSVPGPSTL